MDDQYFMVALAINIIAAFIAAGVMQSKGRSALGGFLIGAVLSVVGVIIALFWPKAEEQKYAYSRPSYDAPALRKEYKYINCPKCRRRNLEGTQRCLSCNEMLPPYNNSGKLKIEYSAPGTSIEQKADRYQVCWNCRSTNPVSATFCHNCGKALANIRCPQCETENPKHSTFCLSCGTNLSSTFSVENKQDANTYTTDPVCPKCGHQNSTGTTICSSCGDTYLICPNCHATNLKSAIICDKCDKSLRGLYTAGSP